MASYKIYVIFIQAYQHAIYFFRDLSRVRKETYTGYQAISFLLSFYQGNIS